MSYSRAPARFPRMRFRDSLPVPRRGPVYYRRMRARVSIVMMFPLFSLACASGPENPSFPLKVTDARTALRQMEDRPKPLQRPVLVIGGYLDFGVTPSLVRSELRAVTADDRIAPVALSACNDFDDCGEKVIAAVDQASPPKDPEFPPPVDVIGVSMGGLAARYAAAPDPAGKPPRRLKIARLFTISSPHKGAVVAIL